MSPDADGNEAATGISRALGTALIGRYNSDWMVESMQEIVSELKKEQRKFSYTDVRVDSLGTLSAIYRRQVAARRPELAFTSRSMEESHPRTRNSAKWNRDMVA